MEREECFRLFDACAAHRVGDILTLAAMTGLRKRELFGLEWSAVNRSEGVMSVRGTVQEVRKKGLSVKEPKTTHGRRAINLGKQTLLVLTVTLVVRSYIKDSTAPFTQTRTRWKSGILGQRW
ncbi:MAG: hypothetical protein NTX48_04075 [Planctomycetales bacterium]|nr:hypothetical protein [Planctomycetales bacterium]